MASSISIREAIPANTKSPYLATSPDGLKIEIPKELFMVLCDFLDIRKNAGSMVVHFKNGGVAGLETLTRKKYK